MRIDVFLKTRIDDMRTYNAGAASWRRLGGYEVSLSQPSYPKREHPPRTLKAAFRIR